jgi:hypothetical protein
MIGGLLLIHAFLSQILDGTFFPALGQPSAANPLNDNDSTLLI